MSVILLPLRIMEKFATASESISRKGLHLLVVEGQNFKRSIYLEDPTYSIGRSSSNSVVISSQDISRYHATLIRRTHTKNNSVSFWILDGDLQGNRSTNGILVNQKKCLVHELKHKDRIVFSQNVRAYYYILQSEQATHDANLYSSIEQSDRSPSKPLTPTIVSVQNDAQPEDQLQPVEVPNFNFNSHKESDEGDRQLKKVPTYQAFYDLVTDLPNHVLFSEQLSTALALAKRNQYPLAVLSIDLKDEQHHHFSDSNQLLFHFIERVKSCLRSGDVFARWEENQFAILLPQIDQVESAAKVSQRILAALETPLVIDKQQVPLHSSIGIALFPEDGEAPNTILAHSQTALGQSQPSAYRFYNPIIISKASERAKLKDLLHQAFEQQEFRLDYQPQVSLKAKQICGVEAFLRWSHPEVSDLSSARLMALCEEFGLSAPISEWALRTACAQNRAWQKAGIPPFRVAVNLSPQQFHQPNLVDMVAQVLQQTGLEPNWLELEVTESALTENTEFASRALNQLQKLGVCASIDDFGTGHTSVHYLKDFPLRALKIDRSLVHSLNGERSQKMISALIALGQIFGLKVVAQGVETAQQLHQLRQLQCEEMQGDRFSPPLEAKSIFRLFTHLPGLKFPPKKQNP